MNTTAIKHEIEQVLNTYRDLLDSIPDEQFDVTPADGRWSYAEVYSHILQATIGATIAAERCANGTCEPTREGLNWTGRLTLWFGYLPETKVAPAESVKIAVKKISKEDARNLIIKCRSRLETIALKVKQSSGISRFRHSRLGMMNAKQWFKFTLIHLKHHLKQIQRLKNKFA